jgi:hypothetical protein
MFITTLTHALPVVSIKYPAFQTMVCDSDVLLGTQLFRKLENIPIFIWLYVVAMTGIVFFTIINTPALALMRTSDTG